MGNNVETTVWGLGPLLSSKHLLLAQVGKVSGSGRAPGAFQEVRHCLLVKL